MITNSVKGLEDGAQMLAAFPNAQGRLLGVARVRRLSDRYLFETEEATRGKIAQNLMRFTHAGDFFVEDLSNGHVYFELFGPKEDVYHPQAGDKWPGSVVYELPYGTGYFVPNDWAAKFRDFLTDENKCLSVSDELYETLRIECGLPIYGVDMDETTIVPELGLDGLISYNKGCYVGQEIIARIHFRGHVAKQLTGLILSEPGAIATGSELTTPDGKGAGRITSVTFSPKLDKTIALAFVRYDYLADGTELLLGDETVTVTTLPFID